MIGTIGPVVTMVLALVFLDERITGVQLLGAALVLAGVTLVTVKGRAAPSARASRAAPAEEV